MGGKSHTTERSSSRFAGESSWGRIYGRSVPSPRCPAAAFERRRLPMASTDAPATETLIPAETAKILKMSESTSASPLAASQLAQQASTSPASDPKNHGAQNSAPSDLDRCAQKLRGRPFAPGQSGNPQRRPKGSRNGVTRAVEALIEGQGEALGAKALERHSRGTRACCVHY